MNGMKKIKPSFRLPSVIDYIALDRTVVIEVLFLAYVFFAQRNAVCMQVRRDVQRRIKKILYKS